MEFHVKHYFTKEKIEQIGDRLEFDSRQLDVVTNLVEASYQAGVMEGLLKTHADINRVLKEVWSESNDE